MADKHAPPPVPVTPAPTTQPTPVPSSLFQAEPVLVKTVAGVLAAIVAWLIARGALGEAERDLAELLIPIVAAGLTAWWARMSVVPVARTQDAIELAYTAEPGVGSKPTI